MGKYLKYLLIIFFTVILVRVIDFFGLTSNLKYQKVYSNAQKHFNHHIVRSASQKTSIVYEQFNFHVVYPGLWRSSQPTEESITRMKRYGLKTIINLRCDKSVDLWEKQLADKMGIKYYNFPMSAREYQNDQQLMEILNLMHDPSNQPVLIHCHSGKDRTGLLIALYKLQFNNAKFDDVHKEMLMYGYSQKTFPGIIKTIAEWDRSNKDSLITNF